MKKYTKYFFLFLSLFIFVGCEIFNFVLTERKENIVTKEASGFVLNSTSKTISLFGLNTGKVYNSFISLANTSTAIKFALVNDDIWVAATATGTIKRYKSSGLSQSEPLKIIFLEDSSAPNSILISKGFAYVTGNNSNKVFRVDLATDSVKSVAVGSNPQGMAIDENSNKLYIANSNWSGATDKNGDTLKSISVIDLNDFDKGSEIVKIPKKGAQTITIVGNHIYVVCSFFGQTNSYVVKLNKNKKIVSLIEMNISSNEIVFWKDYLYLNKGYNNNGLVFFHKDSTVVHYKDLAYSIVSMDAKSNYFAMAVKNLDGSYSAKIFLDNLDSTPLSVTIGQWPSCIKIKE